MFHYFNPIQNTKGDALIGYYVRVFDPATGAGVPLYADNAQTPIVSVSGVADAAKVDHDGMVDFYAPLGTYRLDIYASDSTSLVKSIRDVPMDIDINTPGIIAAAQAQAAQALTTANTAQTTANTALTTANAAIPRVPDRPTLAAITGQAAGATRVLVEGVNSTLWVWLVGNYSADVTNDPSKGQVVPANNDQNGLTGAWFRVTDRPEPRHWGAKGDGVTNDAPAWQAAINWSAATRRTIWPSDGTYLWSTPANVGTYKWVVSLPSGGSVKIRGSGKGCVIKTPNNFTAARDYWMLASQDSVVHEGIHIEGICFDGNAANNLVIDSSANVRAAYAILIARHVNTVIQNCHFWDQPGRNVINLADRGVLPQGTVCGRKVRISNCTFRNVGGAIAGNENQNDHSTLYLQGIDWLVQGCMFWNENEAYDPFLVGPTSGAGKACNPIDFHGANCSFTNNFVYNYGGIAAVANDLFDMTGASITHNVYKNIKANGIYLGTYNGNGIDGLLIQGNYMESGSNTSTTGGGAMLYMPGNFAGSSIQASSVIRNLKFVDNYVVGSSLVGITPNNPHVLLTFVDGGEIKRNTFVRSQGSAITLQPVLGDYPAWPLHNIDIDDNEFVDCGLTTQVNSVWAIYVNNIDTTGRNRINNIRIGANNRIIKTPPAVGGTPTNCRGIRTAGAGRLGVRIEMPIFEGGFNPAQLIENTNTHADQTGIQVIPRRHVSTSAANPTAGWHRVGKSVIDHSDPAAGGYAGKVVTTSGAAYGATWAANTAFTQGQWVLIGTKVAECTVSGTTGATNPGGTMVTVGAQYADGTVTWCLKETATAAFKPYGPIAATGGAVTQATSRSTGVTLNTATGTITLFSTTTTAGQLDTFTLTDSAIPANSTIDFTQTSGAGFYIVTAVVTAAGSATVKVYTPNAVGTAEAPTFQFNVQPGAIN